MQEEQYIKIDSLGNKTYYKDKEMTIRHRLDGPAEEFIARAMYNTNPGIIENYWIDDVRVSKSEFDNITAPTVELTLSEIASKFGLDVNKIRIAK